jgi:hypothetical protein
MSRLDRSSQAQPNEGAAMKARIKKTLLWPALALLALGAFAPARCLAAGCSPPSWSGTFVQKWEFESGAMSPASEWTTGTSSGITSAWVTSTNTGGPTCGTNGCNDFVFTQSLTFTASYKIQGSILAATGSEDSYFVQIKGKNDTCGNGIVEWNMPVSGSWVTAYVNNNDGSNAANAARTWSLAPGTYTIEFFGREAQTQIDWIQILLDPGAVVPTPTPNPTPVPSGTGLCELVYNDQSLTGTATYQLVSQVAQNWGNGSPGPAVSVDHFSIHWNGFIEFPATGNYNFSLYSDDGARMWIDGNEIINNWNDQSATTVTASVTNYSMGQHAIIVEYYEDTGSALCYLNWEDPLGNWTIVPQNRLYSGGCVQPTSTPTPASVGSPPTVTSLSPVSGTTAGGNTVVITGTNFTASTTFKVGTYNVGTAIFISSTQMSIVMPVTGTACTVDVVATNSGGTSTINAGDKYTYYVVPPAFQGLVSTERLYGLEYIPFPVQSSGGNSFYDLSYPFNATGTVNTVTGNTQPKNTARWRIELYPAIKNTASNDANLGNVVQVETRIGPYGVSCTTGRYLQSIYSTATSFSPPDRSPNLSTTYFWLDNAPPITEQFDAMGDPREVPYLDMMNGGAFSNNYDWFFKDLTAAYSASTNPDARTLYTDFVPNAKFNNYNGGPHADVPKLFKLWRDAITRSRSIYTSMTGYDSYYIGLGGEIGGDSSNNVNNGILCNNPPWGGANSGSYNYNEIIGNGSITGLVLVRNSAKSWNAMPWIGELWPDTAYWSDWYNGTTNTAAWGNLRNESNGGSWQRDIWSNCDNSNAAYTLVDAQERNSGDGCATMMNGNGGSSTFDHDFVGLNASVANDGNIMGNDYNFPLDNPFNVQRPWGLNDGGNTPPEWSMAPYSANRTTLDVYSASTVSASSYGFYNFDGAGDQVNQKSSAAVRVYDAANQNVGWYIINGLSPANQSALNYVARFALLTCIRTFQDAGVPTMNGSSTWSTRNIVSSNPYRIEPIPYILITSPVPLATFTGSPPLVVTINWNERYARWDDNKYTESYPCLDNANGANPSTQSPCTPNNSASPDNPANEWHGAQPLIYNIKYSIDGGGHWYSAFTPTLTATAGVMMGLPDAYEPPVTLHQHTFSWDVSSLPNGPKVLRVECYRQNIPEHYAYHTLNLTTIHNP